VAEGPGRGEGPPREEALRPGPVAIVRRPQIAALTVKIAQRWSLSGITQHRRKTILVTSSLVLLSDVCSLVTGTEPDEAEQAGGCRKLGWRQLPLIDDQAGDSTAAWGRLGRSVVRRSGRNGLHTQAE